MVEELKEYKGYNLGTNNDFALVHVKAKGQGKVPKALGGFYTSYGQAEQAVDRYLNSLKKGKRSAQTKDSNTG